MIGTYPRRRGELSGQATPNGWAVYEPETDSVHLLNETARAIWELCDGDTSPEEMAQAIAELTDVDLDQAQRDVERTLSELRALKLVSD